MPGTEEIGQWLLLAEEVARAGGEVLLDYRDRLGLPATEFKGRRTELVTAADRAAEQAVVERLLRQCPNHAVLAEEGVLTPKGAAHQDSEWMWIVDPLDGTTNFVHGLPFYSVAVSLVHVHEPVVGVVHAPALDWTFTGAQGHAARRNGDPIQVSATAEVEDALLATGFSYNRSESGADDNVRRLERALHSTRDLRRYGSAALDLCMTAAGHFDGYWEMYLQPYDVAAGAMVVAAAGGQVSDLTGGDGWLHGGEILASNGRLHGRLVDLVGGSR